MASSWTVRDGTFVRHGHPALIFSGEAHYFRIARPAWRARLELAKRLGLNTIGCYIPWLWHEPRPGRFDVTGRTHPQRDLVGFFQLLKRLGLYSFARLGPICHGELSQEGLPSWLLDQHPEIRLRQSDGSVHPHAGLISYAHPTYRAYVSRWYEALLPIIRRFSIERGGPIILLQLDNEISMLNWVLRAPDYGAHVTDAYRAFLRRRYGSLQHVNRTYNSSFASFETLPQPIGHVETEGWLRCLDWARFYRAYYASYFAWLARLVREAGLRLPLVANIPQCYDYNVFARALPGLMTTSMFREFASADPHVLFGGAYQLRHVTFENFHDLFIMNEACRMISSPKVPTICAELQTGVLHDRPRLYPSDVALTLALCFGGGLNGINGYMLAAGENPPGVGSRGRYHEWQAAISGRGTLRPHAQALRQTGQWLAVAERALAASKPLYDDAAFGFYAPYYMTEYASGLTARRLEYLRDQLFFDGLARLMILAGFRLPFVDLERTTLKQLLRFPKLVVFALEFMHRDVQARLLDYVRSGGRLVLYPTIPTKGVGLQPEPLLLLGLGIRHFQEIPGHFASLSPASQKRTAGRQEVFVESMQWAIEASHATVLARTEQGQPCAITKRVGRGTLMVIGFGLTHRFDYQVDVVRSLMARIGLRAHVDVDPWEIPVFVRTGSQGTFVFVCNPHEEARSLTVRVRGEASGIRIPHRGTMRIEPRSCRMLPVDLPVTRGVLLQTTSCELLSLTRTGLGSITLALRQGERGSIALAMPRSLEVTVKHAHVLFRQRQGQTVSLECLGTHDAVTLGFRKI